MSTAKRHVSDTSIAITLPLDSHPSHVVRGAALGFIDRCHVLLDHPTDEEIRVTLRAKGDVEGDHTLDAIGDAFEDRLRSSDLYHRVAADNQVLTDAVVAQAFGSSAASSTPGLDELEAFDFSDDAFEDPLGIAQTWEAKHGRPQPAPKSAQAEQDPQDSK